MHRTIPMYSKLRLNFGTCPNHSLHTETEGQMRIEHVRLINYKGFRDSGKVGIGAKFTILVGQNNAGKTSFLEALNTRHFKSIPFNSLNRFRTEYPQYRVLNRP
jgi:AAA ATPase domain